MCVSADCGRDTHGLCPEVKFVFGWPVDRESVTWNQ